MNKIDIYKGVDIEINKEVFGLPLSNRINFDIINNKEYIIFKFRL